MKLTPAGDFVWVKHFGGPEGDASYGSNPVLKGPGNIMYLTGIFGQISASLAVYATFDNFTLNSTTGGDSFILRFDPLDGRVLWAKKFTSDLSIAMTVDSKGNVIITGNADNSFEMEHIVIPTINYLEAFIVKVSPIGEPLWAAATNSSNAIGYTVAADHDDNIIAVFGTSGSYMSIGDFPRVTATSGSIAMKFNGTDGHLIWMKNLHRKMATSPNELVIDKSGLALVIGYGRGLPTAEIGPVNNATYTDAFPYPNGNDGFLTAFNGDGETAWLERLGGPLYSADNANLLTLLSDVSPGSTFLISGRYNSTFYYGQNSTWASQTNPINTTSTSTFLIKVHRDPLAMCVQEVTCSHDIWSGNQCVDLMNETWTCLCDTPWVLTKDKKGCQVTCPPPPTPNYGTLTVTSSLYPSTATYTCPNGWYTDDPVTRSCNADGTWGGVAPTCIQNPPSPCNLDQSCDPQLDWVTVAQTNSTSSTGATVANFVVLDSQHNVITMSSIPTVPTAVGGVVYTSLGSQDVLVTKVNPTTGSLIWGVQIGGTAYENGAGLVISSDENVYALLTTLGTSITSLIPTLTTFSQDTILVKINGTTGSVVWAQSLETLTSSPVINPWGIAISPFDNSIWVVGLQPYIARFVPNGTVSLFLNPPIGQIQGVTIDKFGFVYIVGTFGGTITWGTISLTSTQGSNGYIFKLDKDTGLPIWGIGVQSAQSQATAIVVDGAGTMYVSGNVGVSTTPLRLGELSIVPTTGCWMAKISQAGTPRWLTQPLICDNLILDKNNHIFVSGYYSGPIPISYPPGAVLKPTSGDGVMGQVWTFDGSLLWGIGINNSQITGLDSLSSSFYTSSDSGKLYYALGGQIQNPASQWYRWNVFQPLPLVPTGAIPSPFSAQILMGRVFIPPATQCLSTQDRCSESYNSGNICQDLTNGTYYCNCTSPWANSPNGLSCVYPCSAPSSIPSASIFLTSPNYPSYAFYTCSTNFYPSSGSPVRACIPGVVAGGNTWSLSAPQCTSCLQNGCSACRSSDGQCTACSDPNAFPVGVGQCRCGRGYYGDPANCTSCLVNGCTRCNSSAIYGGDGACLQCINPKALIGAPGQGCICSPGTYGNGDSCQNCLNSTVGCTACDNRSGQCTACADIHAAPSGFMMCECVSGYYGSPTNCLPCLVNGCTQCDRLGVCTQCANPLAVPSGNPGTGCVCSPGTAYGNGTICQSCIINGCNSCNSVTGQCLTCFNANAHPSGVAQCACDTNRWGDPSLCPSCLVYGCSACDSDGMCYSCNNFDAQPSMTSGGGCVCAPGYFGDGVNCTSCTSNACSQCDRLSGLCTKCYDQYAHPTGFETCECNENFVGDGENCDYNGAGCGPGCSQCNAQGDCIACFDPNAHPNNGSSSCRCNENYVGDGITCISCTSAACTNCSSDGYCTYCRDPLAYPIPSSSQCQCYSGYEIGQDGDCTLTVDCVLGSWTVWSACVATCGSSYQVRTRPLISAPTAEGIPCDTRIEQRDCPTLPDCPPVDCVPSPWSGWTGCSAACGGGTRSKTRTVAIPPTPGGKPCNLTGETEECNTIPCQPNTASTKFTSSLFLFVITLLCYYALE